MLQVIQTGNAAAAPEMRYTPSGAPVAKFRLASNERWTERETGEKKERTTWLTWEVWGKSAEDAAKLIKKGSRVAVRGYIRNEHWQDNDGQDRYRDKFVVETWELQDRKAEDDPDVGGRGDAPLDGDVPV